jgi:hypothetical protein
LVSPVSTFTHERVHQDQDISKEGYITMMEIPAIMAQVNSPTFKKTQDSFKQAMISYAVESMNYSLSHGQTSVSEVKSAINEIMKSRLGDFGFIEYNEESKQVKAQYKLEDVEINAEKK